MKNWRRLFVITFLEVGCGGLVVSIRRKQRYAIRHSVKECALTNSLPIDPHVCVSGVFRSRFAQDLNTAAKGIIYLSSSPNMSDAINPCPIAIYSRKTQSNKPSTAYSWARCCAVVGHLHSRLLLTTAICSVLI